MPTRSTAFAIHLAISATIVGIVLYMIFRVWYWGAYAELEQVFPVVLTLIAVDVVVGPLLTLILYKPGKKNLKLDLALIAVVQVGALLAGLYVSFNSRPVWTVFADGRFYGVNKEEYAQTELDKVPANSPYLTYSMAGPVLVGAKVPADAPERDKLVATYSSALGGGERMIPRYYVPYETMLPEVLRNGKRASEITFAAGLVPPVKPGGRMVKAPSTAQQVAQLQEWLKGLGRPLDKVLLLPLQGTVTAGTMAVDATTGQPIDSVAVSPWWAY